LEIIFWLLLKFVIGLVSIICAALFYVAPLIFLLAPILYPLDFFEFCGIEIKTFGALLLIMLAGAALIWIVPYLGNGLVKMIGGYTRRMVESLAGK